MKQATEAQRKQRHASLRLQTDVASSMANNTPPMGAPNAAASPAAAPADTSSRWSEFENRKSLLAAGACSALSRG